MSRRQESQLTYRARSIAETWGKDAGAGHITFLFDNVNKEEVDTFGRSHPWVTIRHIEGTDKQGDYKRGRDRGPAYEAQRTKTRAVFVEFDLLQQKPDWICYLDDDMMVNVKNLEQDLFEKAKVCSPQCFVADAQIRSKTRRNLPAYTVGGWCMESYLADRVAKMLEGKSDAEVNFINQDDLGFSRFMRLTMRVWATNSNLWYSELSRPKLAGNKFHKSMWNQDADYPETVPTWENDPDFMRAFVGSLAVYHVQYANKIN